MSSHDATAGPQEVAEAQPPAPHGSGGPLGRVRDLLIVPAERGIGPIEALVVVLAAAAVAFFRLGGVALAGRPWAEDGNSFLADALRHGTLHSLFVQKAGYLNIGPRLATAPVAELPIAWQGVGLHVTAALAGGCVAGIAYAALRGQLPGRAGWVARVLIAFCVVAVPVGTEVTGSVANLQWFLLYGGAIGLFWSPRHIVGWVAMTLTALIAVMSSPFGAIVAAVAVVRWVLQRNRYTLVVLVVVAIGFVVQTIAMVRAPARPEMFGFDPGLHPRSQLRGFVARILGDSVFGAGHLTGITRTSIAFGTAVAVTIVVLALLTLGVRRMANLGFVAALLVLSFVTYAAPVVASGLPTSNPNGTGRYYVAPVIFALTAIICLAARSTGVLTASRGRARARFGVAAVISVATLATVGYGVTTSFDLAYLYGRSDGPSWAAAVAAQRDACRGKPDDTPVTIGTPPNPAVWQVPLTCGLLR